MQIIFPLILPVKFLSCHRLSAVQLRTEQRAAQPVAQAVGRHRAGGWFI